MVSKELIVARFKESVDWVQRSPIPATVYNKGEPIALDGDLIEVIELPNRARESGTWLEHIVRCWDSLADISYFCQGWPHQNPDELWRRVAIDYTKTTPLTSQYLDDFPDRAVKDLDTVESVEGVEVRYGLADHFGNRSPEANREWLSHVWRQFFDCPQPTDWRYGYCAMYAVRREAIRARPLEYWLWLRELANGADQSIEMTPQSAWAFEAVWLYLFSDPVLYPGRLIPPNRPPGFATMAANFAGALGSHLLNGAKLASQDVQEARKAICESCDLLDKERNRCLSCGCLAMDLKRSWASSVCPKGKWGKDE